MTNQFVTKGLDGGAYFMRESSYWVIHRGDPSWLPQFTLLPAEKLIRSDMKRRNRRWTFFSPSWKRMLRRGIPKSIAIRRRLFWV